ncbi:RNA ligase/cyclic nucleotide phosphodiesterase [Mycena haematopus]|nr:RNA ligase/cyclic nucleotide phosphodiesterase [Mycena haematopus]
MNPEPYYAQRPKYPAGVPNKFDPEGNVQRYPGNTIICHLSPSSELHKSLLELQDKLKSSHFSHLYALLPPSSWHMTIFEGVCEVHQPGRWPDDLPDDASLAELSSFDLQCDPPYHLTVIEFRPLSTAGIGVHIEPSTPEENARLRHLRDQLSKLLHIRTKDHETYVFHLSVAYMLRFELMNLLADHFKGMPKQFELGPPEFCAFEDMFTFNRLVYLKKKE